MTHTFKLSRRLARLRPILLLPAAILFISCAGGESSGLTSTTDPTNIEIFPESTAVDVDGTVQFEAGEAGEAAWRWGGGSWRGNRPSTVEIAPESATLRPGTSHRFSAYAKNRYGNKVSVNYRWSATGGTVDDAGRYTAGRTPGRYVVVASTWSGASDTASVTITGAAAVVTQVVLSPANTSVAVGGSQQFSAVGKDGDGAEVPITPVYAETGGTISSSGNYTAPGSPGSYRVIATDQASGKADTASVTVTANTPTVNQVVLTPSSVSLGLGGSRQFTAVGKTASGADVSITPAYAATGGTISSSGMYRAGQSAGTYRVIAAHQSSGKADTAAVTIAADVASVTVSPSSADMTVGQTRQLTAAVKDGNGNNLSGQTVSWTSSSSARVTVSSSGLVTAVSAGSATITAASGGRQGQATITVTGGTPEPPPPPSGGVSGCPSSGYSRLVNVSSGGQLSSALGNAQAGDQIQLAPGSYSGNYTVSRSGFTLCGPRSAVLTGDLRLSNVSDVTVQGFTFRGGFQPIFAKNVDRSRFQGLDISNVGQEAIHLMCGSSDNVVRGNNIHDTGNSSARWGEAVYVGTDPSNRSMHCGGSSDATERTQIVDNQFGPSVTGEDVDVKPGADGTLIQNNVSDGSGKSFISGYAESFYVVRANDVRVLNNRASNAPRHGFWNHSGSRVTYHGNVISLSGASGYGFRSDGGSGHVVGCDNTVTGGSFANVSCR